MLHITAVNTKKLTKVQYQYGLGGMSIKCTVYRYLLKAENMKL